MNQGGPFLDIGVKIVRTSHLTLPDVAKFINYLFKEKNLKQPLLLATGQQLQMGWA